VSVGVELNAPGFEEAQWITSEDVNVEHLFNVFTSSDENSVSVWDACAHFMQHLLWHKKQLVMLGPKIKGLPDDHPSKPECLFQLSWLRWKSHGIKTVPQLQLEALEISGE